MITYCTINQEDINGATIEATNCPIARCVKRCLNLTESVYVGDGYIGLPNGGPDFTYEQAVADYMDGFDQEYIATEATIWLDYKEHKAGIVAWTVLAAGGKIVDRSFVDGDRSIAEEAENLLGNPSSNLWYFSYWPDDLSFRYKDARENKDTVAMAALACEAIDYFIPQGTN